MLHLTEITSTYSRSFNFDLPASATNATSPLVSSLAFKNHNFDNIGNIVTAGATAGATAGCSIGTPSSEDNSSPDPLSTLVLSSSISTPSSEDISNSNSSSTPSSKVSSTSPGPSKEIIAGSAIGGIALILLLLSALVIFQRRKNKQSTQKTLITPLPYPANFTPSPPIPRKLRAAVLRDQLSPLSHSSSAGMAEHPTANIQAQLASIMRKLESLEGNGSSSQRATPPDYVSFQ
ncbi:hypothetical protein PQX77_017553 [Marasmius sp. AFHP31]|nr:hypothetical protein PQX77_017553 [Marasmius sp. AFHP31]